MASDFCWAYRNQCRISIKIPLGSSQNSHRIHPCIIPFESIQSPSESLQHPFWKSVLESFQKPCRITLYPSRILIEFHPYRNPFRNVVELLQNPFSSLQKSQSILLESPHKSPRLHLNPWRNPCRIPHRIPTDMSQNPIESLRKSIYNPCRFPYRFPLIETPLNPNRILAEFLSDSLKESFRIPCLHKEYLQNSWQVAHRNPLKS